MRPASVFANPSAPAYTHLYHLLHHRWREATRAVMVLLSAAGLTADEIGELLGCHPATVRRWIHRYTAEASRAWPTASARGAPGSAGRGWASVSAAC
ncbi:hypothetical protein GCM10023080_079770 [Streptomyces pseudoechinosporeus]